MAVAGYQNPLEYQMSSVFDNKEDDSISVAETAQPVLTTTAATQPPQRTATKILGTAGVTSAKDILRTLPEASIGVSDGTISASKILEDYKKEQEKLGQQAFFKNIEAKAKTQEFNDKVKQEAEYRKQEAEYLKNYSLDLTKKPNTYSTRFGNLTFNKDEITLLSNPYASTKDKESFGFYLADVTSTAGQKEDYVFLPFEYISKGMPKDSKSRLINTGFLEKETWDQMLKISQPVDFTAEGGFKNYGTGQEESLSQGYLFKADDFYNFTREYLDNPTKKGRYLDAYNYSATDAPAEVYNTPILGLANYNGNLVYVRDQYNVGSTKYYDTYIDSTGTVNTTFFTPAKERGGVAGVFQDVGKAIAKIPFAPEIIAIAAGPAYGPSVYASLKALQTLGMGGSSGDILKAGATAFATSAIAPQLSNYGKAMGESINVATGGAMSAAVATTVGTSIVTAGFNGFMAAATNQDVGDAMLAGAISGGISANATTITNTVFGGAENVSSLAKTLNLTPAQASNIFGGALAAGSINAAVNNKDFLDAFTESLIVQGVSQAGANSVRSRLSSSLSPKAVSNIVGNTKIFLQATARAAVRGEDMDTAIARVAPYIQARAIGQTVGSAIK